MLSASLVQSYLITLHFVTPGDVDIRAPCHRTRKNCKPASKYVVQLAANLSEVDAESLKTLIRAHLQSDRTTHSQISHWHVSPNCQAEIDSFMLPSVSQMLSIQPHSRVWCLWQLVLFSGLCRHADMPTLRYPPPAPSILLESQQPISGLRPAPIPHSESYTSVSASNAPSLSSTKGAFALILQLLSSTPTGPIWHDSARQTHDQQYRSWPATSGIS